MDGHQCAWRQHGTLDALLAAALDKGTQVAEVLEFRFVDSRFGANGKRHADLRNHHADFSGGNLHPRVFINAIDDPECPAQAGHEQIGLISRLAFEGNQIVFRKLLIGESFSYQSDFRRTNHADGRENQYRQNEERKSRHRQPEHHIVERHDTNSLSRKNV